MIAPKSARPHTTIESSDGASRIIIRPHKGTKINFAQLALILAGIVFVLLLVGKWFNIGQDLLGDFGLPSLGLNLVVFAPLLAFLWILSGRVVINVDSSKLSVARELFVPLFVKNYRSDSIRNLRWTDYPPTQMVDWPSMNNDRRVAIAFDYDAVTVLFARGIPELDAKPIISEIRMRLGLEEVEL